MDLSLSRSDDELRSRFSSLVDARSVADLLEVPYERLVFHAYRCPEDRRYRRFTIPKAAGGSREISAPVTHVKTLHAKLSRILQLVYEPRSGAHGFVRERSVVSNARLHTRKRFVFNSDLVDFFPTIHFGRVRGLFMAAPYAVPAPAATMLAQLCCFDGRLPQGAPTSPVISNMICARLDGELQGLAKREGCLYSRYADDLTFSTNRTSFPRAIGCLVSVDTEVRMGPGRDFQRIVHDNGFAINYSKVRLQNQFQRQEVTGLTVNEKVNVPRSFVRQIRAMLYAWDEHGYKLAETEFRERWDRRSRKVESAEVSFREVLWGKIAFLSMVRGSTDPVVTKFKTWFDRLPVP